MTHTTVCAKQPICCRYTQDTLRAIADVDTNRIRRDTARTQKLIRYTPIQPFSTWRIRIGYGKIQTKIRQDTARYSKIRQDTARYGKIQTKGGRAKTIGLSLQRRRPTQPTTTHRCVSRGNLCDMASIEQYHTYRCVFHVITPESSLSSIVHIGAVSRVSTTISDGIFQCTTIIFQCTTMLMRPLHGSNVELFWIQIVTNSYTRIQHGYYMDTT